MIVDRRLFLASLGVGSVSGLKALSSEDKADALEHYMIAQLDGGAENASLQQGRTQQGQRRAPRGTGGLFQPRATDFEPMPDKPTLYDFFRLRFAPANHVLQSATYAMENGQPEKTILACLLHDVVLNLIKPNHGDWGGQLFEPYVPPEISWGIKYHAPLRFYPDDEVGYEYPEMYNRMFGEDYVPSEITRRKYEFARKHKWYMEARLITLNDKYAFEEGKKVSIEPFEDIIGRYFKTPPEGLGNDESPSAHMWRTMADPTRPL